MAFLITCSSKKVKPFMQKKGAIEQLSFDKELGAARKELIDLLQIQLDWDRVLPASELYDGKVYRKISERNWKNHHSQIKILSALFGWVKPTDLLPYYDLKMDDKIKNLNNTTIYKFWREKNILENVVDQQDIDLLSQMYRNAFNNAEIAQKPSVKFKGYGDEKGEWLNKQLNLL